MAVAVNTGGQRQAVHQRRVGIFPNDASVARLVGTMLLEQNDEWSPNRRYMQSLRACKASAILPRLGPQPFSAEPRYPCTEPRPSPGSLSCSTPRDAISLRRETTIDGQCHARNIGRIVGKKPHGGVGLFNRLSNPPQRYVRLELRARLLL